MAFVRKLSILKMIGIFLVGCLATYGQSATMVRLGEKGVNRLRQELFDKLHQDLVGVPHGGDTLGNDNDCGVFQVLGEGLPDGGLRGGVHRRGRHRHR